jgi:hypothetical protein
MRVYAGQTNGKHYRVTFYEMTLEQFDFLAAARQRKARGKKSRGGRSTIRTIKTSAGKVTVALSRKAAGDDALLAALEEAVAQVRAARAFHGESDRAEA